jgi:hypothetical protein
MIFFLSVPIKYDCRCIVYKNKSELELLAQCGKQPKVLGSILMGLYFWMSLFCCK